MEKYNSIPKVTWGRGRGGGKKEETPETKEQKGGNKIK